MQIIKNKIDFISTALSLVCLIQCLMFPLLAIFGVVFFDIFSHDVEHLVIIGSMMLSLLVTYHTYKVHKLKTPLFISLIGLVIFIFNEVVIDEHYMHIIVSLLVGISHVLNYLMSKNKCKHPHDCVNKIK